MLSRVDFCILAIDRQPYPGLIEPAHELLTFSTEWEAIQTFLFWLLALLHLWIDLWVSIWDWLFVGWAADWQLICEATKLLFFPKGTGYYGMAT